MGEKRSRQLIEQFVHGGLCGFLILLTPFGWADELPVSHVSSRHPLTLSQMGDVLIGELQCRNCHGGREKNDFLEKAAPDLSDVGARVDPDYLRRFLASPSETQPGTSMPNMMASHSSEKRDEIAEALTHFLVSQSKRKFAAETVAGQGFETGKELFHTVGCVACHTPRELIEVDQVDEDAAEEKVQADKDDVPLAGIDLSHVVSKYSPNSLSEFLFQPLRVRSSGRMPDMKLTTSESESLATYLIGEQTRIRQSLEPREPLIGLGRKYFQELNCSACHAIDGIAVSLPLVSLKYVDLARGCISNVQSKGPMFHLEAVKIKAIAASLQEEKVIDSDQVAVAKSLTAFNCIACHIRDNFGGVAKDRNVYFRSTEKNLGDDGRIPPPLTLLGAKLQPVWLKKVLFDGEVVRSYMNTRMPQYGEQNLRHLPSLLARTDRLEHVDLKLPSPESNNKAEQEKEKRLRAGGRELLGDKGLNCVACHNFNGKPSPLNKGIDLMTTYQRLQPAWFNKFLINPGAFRPRIVMPYSWPGGIAAHKDILDGDTELQIEAIWYYLSLGTSAADPPGIRRIETKLSVADKTRTYRGRSSVAGFRGIAVGFPEKISYAFNAETGTLAAIWQGDFIRVDRGGQGSGGFNPSGKVIGLAQDVSFLDLADETAPWPLRPVMTKESPVNANPLYPKNLGYQFREYYLDDSSTPTFVYRSGSVGIEDRSFAMTIGDKSILRRTLHFNSPKNQTLWFRALTGEIEEESESVYKTRNLRLTIPKSTALLRSFPDDPKTFELLLRLEILQGKSTLEFTYDPLEK